MTNTLIDPFGSDELHDRIGTLLEPLFTWHGRDFYPVRGAEGDDDTGDDSDSESDDDKGDDTGAGDTDANADTVPKSEHEKLLARLKAADKNTAAAQKKLKEIEDGKKDELTKATERVVDLEKQIADYDKEARGLRLQNAFLSADTGITWQDPGDALALAERRGYLTEVVDDEGKVDEAKLAVKLKELAKAKPHLVKKETEGSSGGKGSGSGGATGSNVGGKGKGAKDKGPDLSRYSRYLNR